MPFRSAPRFIEHGRPPSVGAIRELVRATFKTPIPPMGANTASSMSAIADMPLFTMPADFPNLMSAGAIDLNMIKRDVRAMDRSRLEAEELEDQEAFMALSADAIFDLIDDEPDDYKVPEVKVRFR